MPSKDHPEANVLGITCNSKDFNKLYFMILIRLRQNNFDKNFLRSS